MVLRERSFYFNGGQVVVGSPVDVSFIYWPGLVEIVSILCRLVISVCEPLDFVCGLMTWMGVLSVHLV